eukprot:scaffold86582_cov23-Tisochrysis_lutea.AAC.1
MAPGVCAFFSACPCVPRACSMVSAWGMALLVRVGHPVRDTVRVRSMACTVLPGAVPCSKGGPSAGGGAWSSIVLSVCVRGKPPVRVRGAWSRSACACSVVSACRGHGAYLIVPGACKMPRACSMVPAWAAVRARPAVRATRLVCALAPVCGAWSSVRQVRMRGVAWPAVRVRAKPAVCAGPAVRARHPVRVRVCTSCSVRVRGAAVPQCG